MHVTMETHVGVASYYSLHQSSKYFSKPGVKVISSASKLSIHSDDGNIIYTRKEDS